ncbi:hypothetical protein INN71_14440 [Nocardioides sp. ChNu-153]|uniref:hypothetical protein n=1 Tax=unclassified Nocardioides TaxID=2615069 RepID=UPI0024075E3B|nr:MULTISPECIES: hypothetical protein [unclassified Nocardioides]MDF9717767.1 hypothetical protein [Nocardioides sp. ChNu-99]MDN7122587.1 hypothetical protein [Nocardioides sp. ChNu-153]
MPAPTSLVATRRAVLAAPALAVVLAGCEGGPGDLRDLVGDDAAGATDADRERVDAAVAAVLAARGTLRTVTAAQPGAAAAAAGLLALHDAQLSLLDDGGRSDAGGGADEPSAVGSPTGPPDAAEPAPATDLPTALRAVRVAATLVATRLTDLAVEADSGLLARTLGSMAAAVEQHLAVLPTGTAA